MSDQPRAFVSYSSSDREYADRLLERLQQNRVAVFLDHVNLRHGEQILSALRSQISAADFVVLLLSPDALESPLVQRDLEYALSTELRQRSITVIPVKIRPCKIPDYLATWMVIDATRDFDKAVGRIAALLHAAPLVQLDRLSPARFEQLVGDMLRAYGFRFVREAFSPGDAGFDFSAQSVQRDPFGRPETVDWIIEVKAKRQADVSSLRAFLGVLSLRKERGLFVTSGQVTSPARDWLEHFARVGGPRLSLIEGTEVKRLIMAKPRLVTRYFGAEGEL